MNVFSHLKMAVSAPLFVRPRRPHMGCCRTLSPTLMCPTRTLAFLHWFVMVTHMWMGSPSFGTPTIFSVTFKLGDIVPGNNMYIVLG